MLSSNFDRPPTFWEALRPFTYGLLVLIVLVVTLLHLFGCGSQQPAPAPGTPGSPLDPTPVKLVLWVAPWCTSCKADGPAVDKAVFAKSSVKAAVLVPTGVLPAEHPTDTVTKEYVKLLGLRMPSSNDAWFYTTYRKYWPAAEGIVLPAVVVLDDKDTPILRSRGSTLVNDTVNFMGKKQ